MASRREHEERRVSDELAREAQARHKMVVSTTMKALHEAVFPDEIAHFRDALLKLDLEPGEQKVLWEKIGYRGGSEVDQGAGRRPVQE